MTKINNNPTITNDEKVLAVRGAIEHRATWMSLMIDEAEKAGQDWESMARKAIKRCGCFHGNGISEKLKDKSDIKEFTELFLSDLVKKLFEMDIVELTEDKLAVEFHYCPLVSAWQKQGESDEKMEILCDIAMDGDRGIGESSDHFEFELGKTIAQGNSVCEVFFHKKK
ncbi:conserved hypothetical protein [Alkaliphilus metalliredigens QYMF]|uniref:L-2-amino-thiazoline-4-carboxylic acid hydrolase n=1 Tax=Alkaliphilus metalliredigens (strain QYMF) TaxID=293826 RepID=A6TVI3_ALKMQ|nr:L-2-amino-thiazoline-4-carboxylic acid hydrolase [Alkaliphilus metalliredigens]ABR50201.1 conserved hypothetical protein [Alkaliphilus metalliredigens QYMF]